MKLDYFSKDEDTRFSELVINYNERRAKGNEDKDLYAFIKDRTSVLLYLIPVRNLFLDYDEASEIYLELYKCIDSIIASYKITKTTFIGYLTQICRYRARNLVLRQRRDDQITKDAWFYDYVDSEENYYMELPLCDAEPHYGKPRPEVKYMDLSTLIDYIVENRDNDSPALESKEALLHEKMRDKKERKLLLLLLLSLPSIPSSSLVSSIARVLELDSLVLARFFELKYDLMAPRIKKQEEEYEKGIKHWKSMMRLMRAIEFECDENLKKSLRDKYSKVSKCHRMRMNKANSEPKGLTQFEIADIVGEKRSTVCKSLQRAKDMLEIIHKSDVAPKSDDEL